jgi:hypothetical protein
MELVMLNVIFTKKAESEIGNDNGVCDFSIPESFSINDEITLKFKPSNNTIRFVCLARHFDLNEEGEHIPVYTLDSL